MSRKEVPHPDPSQLEIPPIARCPQEIAQNLRLNPENPYSLKIESIDWIRPEQLPNVFHTTAESGLSIVSPAYCRSFDYWLNGRAIPVTYVLPWPHINRARGLSDLDLPHKTEAAQKTGLPYTYLTVNDGSR